jgi:hypothetical protein
MKLIRSLAFGAMAIMAATFLQRRQPKPTMSVCMLDPTGLACKSAAATADITAATIMVAAIMIAAATSTIGERIATAGMARTTTMVATTMVATITATRRTNIMGMATIRGHDMPTSTGTGATSITGGTAVTAGATTVARGLGGMKAVAVGVTAGAAMVTMARATDARPSTRMTT